MDICCKKEKEDSVYDDWWYWDHPEISPVSSQSMAGISDNGDNNRQGVKDNKSYHALVKAKPLITDSENEGSSVSTTSNDDPSQTDTSDSHRGCGGRQETSLDLVKPASEGSVRSGTDVCGGAPQMANIHGSRFLPFISRPLFESESPSHRYTLRPSTQLRQPERLAYNYDQDGESITRENRDNAIRGAMSVLASTVPGAASARSPSEILDATNAYIRREWYSTN